MFGVGYILGLTTGRLIRENYTTPMQIESDDEIFEYRNKILSYLKGHPYSRMDEIATVLEMEIQKVNGILNVLKKRGNINSIVKDNQYRLYYCNN